MEKKKILIIGGDNGGGSAGDQIMCEAVCDFFVKNGYSVYTDAQSIDWKSPVKGVTTILQLRKDFYTTKFQRVLKSILKIYRIITFPLFCRIKRPLPLLLHGNEFRICFQNSNVILFAGCGGLTDKYPLNVLMWWSITKAAVKCSKPVYISGVGIGPIHSIFCRILIRKIVNNANFVTVRDTEESLMWVKRLSIKNNYDWVPDDACFYKGMDTYSVEPNPNGRLIGINIMKTIFPTSSSIEFFCKELLQITDSMDKFCLIPVTHEDYGVLISMLPYIGLERCVVIPCLSPSAIKNVISQLDFMVSARYHGCVFGVSQEIPTIALYAEEYWENKNTGVLKMFGCQNVVFSVRDIENGKFRSRMKELLNNLEDLKKSISRYKAALENKSQFVYKKILRDV